MHLDLRGESLNTGHVRKSRRPGHLSESALMDVHRYLPVLPGNAGHGEAQDTDEIQCRERVERKES